QSAFPMPHIVLHAPATHWMSPDAAPGHAEPQAPQFLTSAFVSMQTPLQQSLPLQVDASLHPVEAPPAWALPEPPDLPVEPPVPPELVPPPPCVFCWTLP